MRSEDELRRVVLEALGKVSVCWSELPKGVFDGAEAIRTADALLNTIRQYTSQFICPQCGYEEGNHAQTS